MYEHQGAHPIILCLKACPEQSLSSKIERYHRSMKNVVLLSNYFYPWELAQAIADFVEYYNQQRYHESLQSLTPEDVYFERIGEVLTR